MHAQAVPLDLAFNSARLIHKVFPSLGPIEKWDGGCGGVERFVPKNG